MFWSIIAAILLLFVQPCFAQEEDFAPPTIGPKLEIGNNAFGGNHIDYPFVLPKGRKGIQPSLGLGYDSSQSAGLLGVGWKMSVLNIALKSGIDSLRNVYMLGMCQKSTAVSADAISMALAGLS
jgi:hypothetical protein